MNASDYKWVQLNISTNTTKVKVVFLIFTEATFSFFLRHVPKYLYQTSYTNILSMLEQHLVTSGDFFKK